jgi:hypothetical protein
MFRSASVFAIAIFFGLVGVKSTYADTTDEEVIFTHGASGGAGSGACQSTSGGSSTFTQLICELR